MSATSAAAPLLSLKGVSKAFGANQALTGVDFEVDAGEVVALVGDNGAGKSTLIKAIAGVQLCDEGDVLLPRQAGEDHQPSGRDGARASRPSTRTSRCATTSTSSPTSTSVASCSRRALRRAAYFIDETAMEQSALELLDSLAVTTIKDVRAHVGSLSGGQRQAVAIARSLLGEPSVVLLDEPTAALGVSQTEQVLNLIHTLRERGLGVVVISHNLENVFAVADRIVVLRLGRRAATFDVRGVSREDVVSAITGAEFGVGADDSARRTHERRAANAPLSTRGVGGMFRELGRKLAQGEAGTLLVILMVAAIWTFFQFQNDRFLSPGNLTNLMLQQAAVATISIGVVLILLLGRDRPVGRSGERLLRLGHGRPDRASAASRRCWRCSPRLALGALIGLFNGFMITRFRIPSFVVTLAGSLTLVGLQLLVLGETGTINLQRQASSPA